MRWQRLRAASVSVDISVFRKHSLLVPFVVCDGWRRVSGGSSVQFGRGLEWSDGLRLQNVPSFVKRRFCCSGLYFVCMVFFPFEKNCLVRILVVSLCVRTQFWVRALFASRDRTAHGLSQCLSVG